MYSSNSNILLVSATYLSATCRPRAPESMRDLAYRTYVYLMNGSFNGLHSRLRNADNVAHQETVRLLQV